MVSYQALILPHSVCGIQPRQQCSWVFWISKETPLLTHSYWHDRRWIMDAVKGCIYLRTGQGLKRVINSFTHPLIPSEVGCAAKTHQNGNGERNRHPVIIRSNYWGVATKHYFYCPRPPLCYEQASMENHISAKGVTPIHLVMWS